MKSTKTRTLLTQRKREIEGNSWTTVTQAKIETLVPKGMLDSQTPSGVTLKIDMVIQIRPVG